MARVVLFTKEFMFHDDKLQYNSMQNKQVEIIKSLETLKMNYEIVRKSAYGTSTPIWEVTVYK